MGWWRIVTPILQPLSLAVGANVNEPSIYGVSEARFERHLKNGISKQWNFFVEKSLARSWFLSVGYSGAASRNLSNRNQVFESQQNVPASVLATWKQQYIASNGATNPATPAGAESAAAFQRSAEELQRRDWRCHGFAVRDLSAVPISLRLHLADQRFPRVRRLQLAASSLEPRVLPRFPTGLQLHVVEGTRLHQHRHRRRPGIQQWAVPPARPIS